MEIILLILLLVSFGINVFLLTRREKVIEKPVEKPELTTEEEKKQKQIKEAFNNLMNYDENIARRKVGV